MATAFDDLIPPKNKPANSNAFADLVPKPGIGSTIANAFHRVVDFVENPPAAQIIARNKAEGAPQPDAFGSVAKAAPDEEQAAAAITSPAASAFRRSAGRGVIPSLAGAGGFGAGAAVGGTLTAPAEAIPVIGTGVNALGALVGGLMGAYGAATGAGAVQDKAIHALPENVQEAIGQDAATRQADQQQHPYATFSGELAPSLLTMRPGFTATPVAEDAPILTRILAKPSTGMAVGATLGAGQEAAREELSGEGLDPTKIAIASGVQALENRPTALGSKLFQMGGNAATLGMQRAARGAGYARDFFIGRDGTEARQPFDVEATAAPVPPEPVRQLPAPQPEPAPVPEGNAFADLVPASPEPAAVAPAPAPAEAQPAAIPAPAGAVEPGTAVGAGEPTAPALPKPVQASEPQALQEGEQYVRTPAGNKVRTKMEVVPAASLAAAQGDLQNRDRSRDTTALQVQDIIGKFDPELLGNDPSSDRGAPIVHPDNTVLSGNGRMLALNQIYDQHPDKAEAYRQFIESQGHSTEGIDRPVLIRRVTQDMTPEEARQFVVESNKDNKLELSPVERARSDADAVTPEMLDKYAGGDLNSGANAGFVQDFTKSLTAGELGNVIGSDRRLTTAGIERIENAVVAKAYDHPKLLEKLMESSHNEIRAITSSLANVAPAWAKMRAATKNELGGKYDITPDLADAAMRVAEARRRGEKPADILSQQDAFDRLSPATEALIRGFYNPEMTRPASVKSVTRFLQDYIDEASAQKPTKDIFGETHPGKEPTDILNELLRQREGGDTLFDAKEHADDHASRILHADEGQGEGEPGQAQSEEKGKGQNPAAIPEEAASGQPSRGSSGAGSERPGPGGGNGRSAVDGSEPPLEDRSVADLSDKGAYARTHEKGATTDRPSDLRSAVEHLGMKWDDFNLKAPATQMRLLQRAIKEKLGIAVTVDHGPNGAHASAIPYRVAIDQMLDGFHNISGMAAILGLPEKAMSLGGTLTLELRKQAKFYGAFYPGEEKIALPGRTNSFAHEWGHALDYYLMGQLAIGRGKGMSGLIRKAGSGTVRRDPEIGERFADLLNAMFFDQAGLAAKVMELEAKIAAAKTPATRKQFERQLERVKAGAGQHRTDRSQFYKNARAVDGPNQEPGSHYWQAPTEMLARSFEAYVANKAEAAGMSTELISHTDADYLSNADERLKLTYPKDEERQAIFNAFDDLFETLAGKETLGKGEAAAVPENPARREEPTQEKRNSFRNIVRNELGAFADWQRSREKAAGRPNDPKGFLQKANDVRHFFFSGMAAELRALGRRWNSKAIAELHDKLVSEAGVGNRLQRRDFIMARRLRANRYANSIDRALHDYGPHAIEPRSNATILSKEQADDVRGMMVNEEHLSVSPELKTLASRLREISDGIWHDLRAAGFNLGYTRNGHLPRIYDVPKAEADRAGFLKAAQEVYETAGLEETEARQAAAEWYFNLVQSSPQAFDQHQPSADFLKGRALPPEADTLMAPFMVTEPVDLMRRYAEAAAHRIEWAKRFGVDNSELNALFDRMAHEGVDRRDVATIRTMTDIMAGQNPIRHKDPTLNALSSATNTIYGTVALLGRAVFQSLVESVTSGIVLENPAYGIKAMVDLIAGAFGTASAKERRELAEFVGLVDFTNHTQLLADRFGGSYDDPVSWSKINNKLFYNTGLIALTRAQYVHNQGVINAYLSHLSKKLLGAKEDGATEREVLARFKELGIRDPVPFAQWMAGLKGKLPSKDELAEGLDERGNAPWAFDWITATRRLSERIIQDPHAMTKPLFSHTNVGRLMTGIQAFNYGFYENVLKAVPKRFYERVKDRRGFYASAALAATIAGFGSLFLGQLLATSIRVFLTDRERWRTEEENGTLEQYLLQRTATQFIGDPLDPEVQAVMGLKYNRSLGQNLPGPAGGNIIANVSDIAKLPATNSRKNNTAEHNAINGAYRMMSPWVSAGAGSLPGGPLVSGAEGAAQSYITSPQAGQDFATVIVGPKNGRLQKDGTKVKSGPTALDRYLDEKLGPVEHKKKAAKNPYE